MPYSIEQILEELERLKQGMPSYSPPTEARSFAPPAFRDADPGILEGELAQRLFEMGRSAQDPGSAEWPSTMERYVSEPPDVLELASQMAAREPPRTDYGDELSGVAVPEPTRRSTLEEQWDLIDREDAAAEAARAKKRRPQEDGVYAKRGDMGLEISNLMSPRQQLPPELMLRGGFGMRPDAGTMAEYEGRANPTMSDYTGNRPVDRDVDPSVLNPNAYGPPSRDAHRVYPATQISYAEHDNLMSADERFLRAMREGDYQTANAAAGFLADQATVGLGYDQLGQQAEMANADREQQLRLGLAQLAQDAQRTKVQREVGLADAAAYSGRLRDREDAGAAAGADKQMRDYNKAVKDQRKKLFDLMKDGMVDLGRIGKSELQNPEGAQAEIGRLLGLLQNADIHDEEAARKIQSDLIEYIRMLG